jgi:uncharacterized damage-inducible protein DinB
VAELIPELQGYIHQIDVNENALRSLADRLSESQATWRPGTKRWSIVECIHHLNRTTTAYLPAIDEAIDRAKEMRWTGSGPFRYGRLGTWLVRAMEPPPKRRYSTMAVFMSPAKLSFSDTAREFSSCQERLRQRVHRSNGLDLARARVMSPATRVVRFRLGQCFAFLLAHERRHLWQAHRVMETAGFPQGEKGQ